MISHLKIVVKPKDYRLGDGQLKLTGVVPTDWLAHFDFNVPQLIADGDTDDCWDFGGTKNVDAFMDALITEGKLPKDLTDWFTSVGFMDTGIDGKLHFHSSERWAGVLSGLGQNGGSLQTAYDIFRKNGVVPFTKLPVTKDMTLAQYFDKKALTPEITAIGKEFLIRMGGKDFCQYQWVNDGGPTNIPAMVAALQHSPLALGIPVGNGWNQVNPPVATGAPVHVVSGYAITGQSVNISDNYIPFLKVLSPGHQISYAMQMIVQYIPPPPVPPAPPTAPVTSTSLSLWLATVGAWLNNWLERLSPTGRARLCGADRSSQWPAFKKQYALTHLPVCAVCGGTAALNLHHLKPFHVFPELELDPENVIWLCNAKQCHIRIGHLGNFQSINPVGKDDIVIWRDKFRDRPMTSEAIKEAFPKVAANP